MEVSVTQNGSKMSHSRIDGNHIIFQLHKSFSQFGETVQVKAGLVA